MNLVKNELMLIQCKRCKNVWKFTNSYCSGYNIVSCDLSGFFDIDVLCNFATMNLRCQFNNVVGTLQLYY